MEYGNVLHQLTLMQLLTRFNSCHTQFENAKIYVMFLLLLGFLWNGRLNKHDNADYKLKYINFDDKSFNKKVFFYQNEPESALKMKYLLSCIFLKSFHYICNSILS